jgi:hypothetical protein
MAGPAELPASNVQISSASTRTPKKQDVTIFVFEFEAAEAVVGISDGPSKDDPARPKFGRQRVGVGY